MKPLEWFATLLMILFAVSIGMSILVSQNTPSEKWVLASLASFFLAYGVAVIAKD